MESYTRVETAFWTPMNGPKKAVFLLSRFLGLMNFFSKLTSAALICYPHCSFWGVNRVGFKKICWRSQKL